MWGAVNPRRTSRLLSGALVVLLLAQCVLARRLQDIYIPSLISSSGAADRNPTKPKLAKHVPDPKFVEGIIQAGFPRERAVQVGNDDCCARQIDWLYKNPSEAAKKHDGEDKTNWQCNIREKTDYDGYAVIWGINHKTETAGECCDACKRYKSQPPSNFPCNVWVWCGAKPGCFAPAAHDFTFGQCWLKYQEDPTNPHVNMQGDYDAVYHRRHPAAPQSVQWVGGVVVPPDVAVKNGTWSARANW